MKTKQTGESAMTQAQKAAAPQSAQPKQKPANEYRIINTTGYGFNAATTDIIRR